MWGHANVASWRVDSQMLVSVLSLQRTLWGLGSRDHVAPIELTPLVKGFWEGKGSEVKAEGA